MEEAAAIRYARFFFFCLPSSFGLVGPFFFCREKFGPSNAAGY